ncbi:hypothetical protein AC1031_018499 [Aphanomyces cochlioides]|nr:hypothetical protein AC1031_018499 [Aphanomyces cochlioides]
MSFMRKSVTHLSSTASHTPISAFEARKPTTRGNLHALFDFASWILVFVLMVMQLVNVFLPTITTDETFVFGSNPFTASVQPIPGNLDDPYMDRAMACVLNGHVYKAATLTDALKGSADIKQFPNITSDSFTVLTRSNPQMTHEDTYTNFDTICSSIALSIDGIQFACADQGYLPVTDSLRIDIGIDATKTTELSGALPILIFPISDNNVHARYGIPGKDGVFCSIMLYNEYVGPGSFYQVSVINRTDYDTQTRLWLKEPRGTWKNGWYTFPDNSKRYYSHIQNDMQPKDQPGGLGVASVVYDALEKRTVDCVKSPRSCENQVDVEWENILVQNATQLWAENVRIKDANQSGLSWSRFKNEYALSNNYDWGMLVSSISTFGLLARWGLSFLALWRGYRQGSTQWYGCGLGILSCSRSFVLFPVLCYPAMKVLCLCFWASCLDFYGDLQAIGNAWSIIYPALAQFILTYYALLNWIAKSVRVRMSDRTFGPVLLAFWLGHSCRRSTITSFGDVLGASDHISSLVFATSFGDSSVSDIAFSQALVIGGNVKAIFIAKLFILSIPLLDLIFFSDRVGPSCKYQPHHQKECSIEGTLALRANCCGGLGKSTMYTPTAMNAYEVVRLGHILFGQNNLISFNDYYVIVLCYFSNVVNETYNRRVLVLDMTTNPVAFSRTMYHWSHPRFNHRWYDIVGVDLE